MIKLAPATQGHDISLSPSHGHDNVVRYALTPKDIMSPLSPVANGDITTGVDIGVLTHDDNKSKGVI